MSKVRPTNQRGSAQTHDAHSGHEGVAFVATLRGTPGRDVLDTALAALENLHHGCSQASGVLTHIPDRVLRAEIGSDLPPVGRYAVGFAFLQEVDAEQHLITEIAAEEGFAVLTWREVPINDTIVEIDPRALMPAMRQVVLFPAAEASQAEIDAGLYRLRRRVEQKSPAYFASLSRTTIVYKGLVPAPRLAVFYSDLADPMYRTEIAVVHSCQGSHYESWNQAQPHRILAHDGAIHSYGANRTWLDARLPLMESDLLGSSLRAVPEERTAEGSLDEFIELLHRSGRQLTHALRMAIPEQWGNRMSEAERDFYDYSTTVVEPWEGSGVTCFADGYLVGAVLDRHGTRSGRYWVTETGLVVFASETGVVDLDPSTITKKGRLAPGELIAVDTVVGNLLPSDAVRAQIASKHPYGQWLRENLTEIDADDAFRPADTRPSAEVDPAYHLTAAGVDAVRDLAAGKGLAPDRVASRQLTFFDRFRSQRSQLTTPYIDAVAVPAPREVFLGPERNVLRDGPEHARKVSLPGPVLATGGLQDLREHLRVHSITGVYSTGSSARTGMRKTLDNVRSHVDRAIEAGAQVLLLSNRGARSGASIAVPSLLLAATAHEHLLRTGNRGRVSLLVEAGDAVEPVHVLRLLAAGAEAVVPYHGEAIAGGEGAGTYLEALTAAVHSTLLESGVAEYRAYQGSRRFHIIGLEPELVREVFHGAPQALGTLDLENLGEQLGRPHLTLDPVHQLLTPKAGEEIDLAEVESVEEILSRLITRAPLEITDTRAAVDLISLATAEEVLLTPPAHHDTVGPDGLRLLIDELRNVNPQVRLHVRVGADLTSGSIGLEAIHAGADVIDLVDGEYEWVFGLISLAQHFAPEGAHVAVATPLSSAAEIFIAAALGAKEYRLSPAAHAEQVAEDLRELLARAGVRRLEDAIGRSDLLDWSVAVEQWGHAGVDLTAIRRSSRELPAPPAAEDSLDATLIGLAKDALDEATPVRINAFVSNTDVSVGARTAGEIARKYGAAGLAEDTIRVTLTGSSGAALGAYGAPGMTIIVQGEAGDFVGKGLSGGKIIVRPEVTAGFSSQENVIAGSAIGYGAEAGGIYLAGEVGERVGAHNWGATIVCEGAGDAAGYRMHAGTLVILGEVGVNLGAGMEGGVIYALDLLPESLHRPAGKSEELEVGELGDLDERVLTAILAEHAEVTKSRVATMLLADPDQLLARFTRIHRPGYAPHHNGSRGVAENAWSRVLNATQTP